MLAESAAEISWGRPVGLKRRVLSQIPQSSTHDASTTLAALLNNKRLWFKHVGFVCRVLATTFVLQSVISFVRLQQVSTPPLTACTKCTPSSSQSIAETS